MTQGIDLSYSPQESQEDIVDETRQQIRELHAEVGFTSFNGVHGTVVDSGVNSNVEQEPAPEQESLAIIRQNQLISSAERYLGRLYATAPDGTDGFGSIEPEIDANGRTFYRVLNNVTREIEVTYERPYVCSDFVVQVLSDYGDPGIQEFMSTHSRSDHARTRRIEDFMNENTNYYDAQELGLRYTFNNGIEGRFSAQVGDVITTTNIDTGFRHIGIVARVDSDGFPLEMIHSSGANGVARTPFLNTMRYDSADGNDRFDGFLGNRTEINYLFRPKFLYDQNIDSPGLAA